MLREQGQARKDHGSAGSWTSPSLAGKCRILHLPPVLTGALGLSNFRLRLVRVQADLSPYHKKISPSNGISFLSTLS